ncbi:MAG: ABC transporter permease [Synergistaceae bacterium]|jgi:peptide/nickel transport system permease protein|nr:ABC transporter permease [Synergistaceae bacterium]
MAIVRKNSNLHLALIRLRRNRLALLGLAVLFVLVFTAVFADFIAPYDYAEQDLLESFEPPSRAHWFGTDEFGRDILSRVIYGGRISLQVGIVAVALALFIGGMLGAAAGYYGGRVDEVVMRVMDILISVPRILLSIAIAAVLGPGMLNLMIAIAIAATPAFARVIRGAVLSIIGNEYVEAARCMGATDTWIIVRHILPNCMGSIIVLTTLDVATAILAASSLSFLGLGIQPPYPEWGAMLSAARGYLRDDAYMTVFPGLAIMITIMSLNFLGDGLRDAFDPKQKR